MSNRIGIGIDVFGAGIDADAQTIYNRIIVDGGVSNLTRLNFFVKGLKTIYGDLANVPVCYDAHWIGYKLGSGTGATAGQAAAKLYSLTVAGDAVQTTAASQPLLLAHNGASSDNYYQGVNAAGNYVGTSATVTAPTQLDVVAYVIASPAHVNSTTIISNDGTARNFVFNCVDVTLGTLQLRAGTPLTSYNSTVGVGNFNNYTGWIRATYNQNGINGDVTFFTSSDSPTTNYNSLNWTQLGSIVTSASTGLQTGTSSIQVGANNTTNNFQGKISRATISNSIGGTPVVDFNPATYNAATSQTAWTSATGEVWTINESTAATYHGALVNRTMVMGDGVDDKLIASNSTIAQPDTIYSCFKCNYSGGNPPSIYESSLLNRQFLTRQNNTLTNSFAGVYLSKTANVKSLNLITNLYNGLNSDVQQNNGASTIGNAGLNSLGALNLLGDASNTASVFAPAQINTFLVVSLNDSLATRTATYEFIKSLNGNAF